MNTHIQQLLANESYAVDEVKEHVAHELKHFGKKFAKYANTMETSMELIAGLYDQDLSVELLIAPTQFGKTSTVFWTAYNLMTHSSDMYFVPYPFVFIMTGLNSNSWKEQTRDRVLPCMKENVWHNKDLCKPENARRLKEAVMSEYNTLIIIDEVHVGTKLDHVIFNTLREFHPENDDREVSQPELFEFLHEKRVKFLLVSATPDAVKETLENNWDPSKYKTIKARPESASTYVWHKDFLTRGRVHQAHNMKDRTENGVAFHKVIAQRISEYSSPMYHMIRFPMDTKTAEINLSRDLLATSIEKLRINADIVMWDAKNTIKSYFISQKHNVFQNTAITPDQMMKMSNEEILKEKPLRHTIFILKELFRVAQTMPIDNIGVLVDRDTKNPCDSTLSQSLIGRACGHNKEKFIDQILIYTHVDSVINYVNLWEMDFDYSKVPGYSGNGLVTTKNGTKITAKETMLGKKVSRDAKWTDQEEPMKAKPDVEDQEDTPERLVKMAKAYNRKNGIVRGIIDTFAKGPVKDIKHLGALSKNGVINFANYDRYDQGHRQFRILEKIDGVWMIRQVVKEYLNV